MKKLLYTGLLLANIALTTFSCEAEPLENEQQIEELATEPGDDGTIEETDPDDDGEG